MRSDNCPISGHPCQSLCDEPCNKSCAPGYCYCEPIIQPEIKGHNAEPPPEAQTEAEKIAYCAGWWAAMEAKREQPEQDWEAVAADQAMTIALLKSEQTEPVAWMVYTQDGKSVCVTDNPADFTDEHRALPLYTHSPRQWQGLTDEERGYFRACGFVGVSRVEEVLRAKNSTPACITAVPPG